MMCRDKDFLDYNRRSHKKLKATQKEDVYEQAEQEESFANYIIINHEGRPYRYWSIIIVTLQVISSYIYAVLSAYR